MTSKDRDASSRFDYWPNETPHQIRWMVHAESLDAALAHAPTQPTDGTIRNERGLILREYSRGVMVWPLAAERNLA